MAFITARTTGLTLADVPKSSPSSMYGTINDIVNTTKAYADNYSTQLTSAMNELSNVPDYVDGAFNFDSTPINIGDLETVLEPSYPVINDVSPLETVDEAELEDVGTFTEEQYPDSPTLAFDESEIVVGEVERPSIDTDITVERATAPGELALAIDIETLIIGDIYEGNFEEYDFEGWDDLLVPVDTSKVDTFVFPESEMELAEYSSVIEPALIPVLLQELADGSHGLTDEVFNAIVDMDERKRSAVEDDARELLVESMGDTGFDVPPGVIVAKVTEFDRNVLNKTMDSIDSTKVESFNLAQKNTHHVRDLLLRAEEVFSQRFVSIEDLKVKVKQFIHDTALARFKALVDQLNAAYDNVRIQIEVKSKKLDAVIAYNGQERNRISTDIEKARLEVDSVASKNGTAIEAARALSNIHEVNATIFKVIQATNIDEARFKIEKSAKLLDMYAIDTEVEKVKAEIKVEIKKLNDEQNTIQAEVYKIEAGAVSDINNCRIEILRGKLETNKSKVDLYTALVSAKGESKNIELGIESLKANITQTLAGVYDTRTRAALSKYQGEIEKAKLFLQKDNQFMTGVIAQENSRLSGFQVSTGLKQEALKVHGQFATQAFASSIGVANVNLGYSYSGSEGVTASRGITNGLSNTLQEAHKYTEK